VTAVVTIVRGRAGHLHNLVLGLLRGSQPPAELVVVVMGGDDPTLGLPTTPFPLRTVSCEPTGDELPLARARNLGVATTTSPAVVLLDVDCIPGRELVARYTTALTERAALLMGSVRYLDPGAADADWTEHGLHRRSQPHPSRPVPAAEGAVPTDRYELFWSLSFGVRRTTFVDTIGGFDEQLDGYGGEDTDLAFAARAAGVPLAWLPAAVAYHQHHDTFSPPLNHLRSIVANARRFRAKWGIWPMEGWLTAFEQLGLVRWDSAGDDVEVVRDPTPEEVAAARKAHVVSDA
jgi:GT2 family glycosyltransferase